MLVFRRHLQKFLPAVLLALSCCVGSSTASERKYGLLARSDEQLVDVVRQSDAVVLGRVDEDVKAGDGYDLHVSVLECYKGSFKPGDVLFVAIVAEEGPDPKGEIGAKRFFFLNKNERKVPEVAGAFWCDWMNNWLFKENGDAMRKVLRSVPDREIATLDRLLTVSEDRAETEQETFPGIAPSGFGGWSGSLVSICWAPRAELLARKRFWRKCLATGVIPSEPTFTDPVEALIFSDFSVCEYQQSTLRDDGEPKGALTYAEPYTAEIWKRWIGPDKGAAFFKKLTVDFPASAQAEPDETSWCVMLKYYRDGTFHIAHFYVPSRLEIQTLLHEAQGTGPDCAHWDDKDKRFGVADWMKRDLKYDYAQWHR